MNQAVILFLAVFLCGFTLKCGESFGEMICMIIKQAYLLHKKKVELKKLKERNKKDVGI
jgi:hypothetical protein